MRISGSSKQVNRRIFGSVDGLVLDPAFDAWTHMTSHAGHVLVRRSDPALVRGSDRMAARAEFWMVREGNGQRAQAHGSSRNREHQGGLRLPVHAPGV